MMKPQKMLNQLRMVAIGDAEFAASFAEVASFCKVGGKIET